MKAAVAICLGLWLSSMPGTAGAEASRGSELARSASEALARATQALSSAQGARDRVAALTEVVQAYEAGLSALRDGLRESAIRERALRAEFEAEDTRLQRLTGVLLTMQASPEALLLLHPSGPTETARAGMLVASVAPALRSDVARLRARLEELQAIEAVQRDAARALAEGLEGVQDARTRLSQAIAERAPLPPRLSSDPAAVQALINSAETLDAFASGLAETAPGSPGSGSSGFTEARGLLPLPVAGVVLRGFREADAAGVVRPGLILATAPEALVTTPWPATVRYAGPLLDYGNVIILEPQTSYLLVLAGLSALYARQGDVVEAGAPLGLMGGESAADDQFLASAAAGGGQDRSETLYMELRQDQEPQDPAEWFIAAAEIGRER